MATNFLIFFAAEARGTHTDTNQQKTGLGGADWDMPPSNCLPATLPSRATHPLVVPRPNSPSTHRPTRTAGRVPCAPSTHAEAHTVPNSPHRARSGPLPTLNHPRPLASLPTPRPRPIRAAETA